MRVLLFFIENDSYNDVLMSFIYESTRSWKDKMDLGSVRLTVGKEICVTGHPIRVIVLDART